MLQRKIQKKTAVTLQVSPKSCQRERYGGMSEMGQETKERTELRMNKDLRQSSLQSTSLHAVFAVPQRKHSPCKMCEGCWFHMAHLTKTRPDDGD